MPPVFSVYKGKTKPLEGTENEAAIGREMNMLLAHWSWQRKKTFRLKSLQVTKSTWVITLLLSPKSLYDSTSPSMVGSSREESWETDKLQPGDLWWTACLPGSELWTLALLADLPSKHISWQNPCSNETPEVFAQYDSQKKKIFEKLLSKFLTNFIAARNKAGKTKTKKLWGLGVFKWLVTYPNASSQRKWKKKKTGRKNKG